MNRRVIVLGSINVDLLASVQRLPGAGETIVGENLVRQLGGKGANQAVAAARADMPAALLGATGNDAEGAMMAETLVGCGVNVAGIVRVPGPTGHALVVTSPRDNQIVVMPGANAFVDERVAADAKIGPGDVCLTQMETPATAAVEFFVRARAAGATTMLNAAPASEAVLPLLPLTDILVVNEGELELLGRGLSDPDHGDMTAALAHLGPSLPRIVIVTLGAKGLAIVRDGAVRHTPGWPAKVVDTTGAGDCFCGYLAAGLARGDSLESAASEANFAASIAVQSLGAANSIPSRSAIITAYCEGP